MEGAAQNLSNKFNDFYIMGERERKEMLLIVNSWVDDSREEQMNKLSKLINRTEKRTVGKKVGVQQTGAQQEEESDRADYKTNEIIKLSGTNIKSVMDIGAGTGEILISLASKLKISSREKVLAVETKLTKDTNKVFKLVSYKEDGTLPIESNSIDLIVFAAVLHHIHPVDRLNLLTEVNRIMSPNGVCIIQEHDYDKTVIMYLSLDILHNFWYIVNKELVDPLYLMSQQETKNIFAQNGLTLKNSTQPRGWQKMYWASYGK